MARLRDMMQDLQVSGSSPDKTITITAEGSPARIAVKLAEGSTRDHTVESFERQMNAAIRIAMMAYRQSATRAWRQAAGMPPVDDADDAGMTEDGE